MRPDVDTELTRSLLRKRGIPESEIDQYLTGPGSQKQQIQDMPFTSADIAQSMDVDTDSPEYILGSAASPTPPVGKIASVVKAAKLAELGVIAGPLIKAYGGKANVPEKVITAFKEASPRIRGLRRYMTPEELEGLSPENIAKMAEIEKGGKGVSIKGKPRLDASSISTMALAGKAKKGWYKNSAQTLTHIFGSQDNGRFAALLAATSPQISVQGNLVNSLNIWKNWTKAGRPTDKKEITKIMADSVQGGTEASVMDAWKNNTIRALSAADPHTIKLSGPKVQSFYKNLTGNMDEVTNDTWQGRAFNLEQSVFGGANRLEDGEKLGVKSPGYILSSAATRNAAEVLEKSTGEKWLPAEIQETVWSYVKALFERRKGSGKRTMQEISPELTYEEIVEVPDFGTLLRESDYATILDDAGYGEQLRSIPGLAATAKADVASVDGAGSIAAVNRRLEQQYKQELENRATDSVKILKNVRDRIHKGLISDRTGTGTVKRTFTGKSTSNPGGELKGLGKLQVYNLSKQDQQKFKKLGISTPNFYELPPSIEAANVFERSIKRSKENNTYAAAVYVYSPAEYQQKRLFLTKDGKTGFAVSDDGDIVSVFNTKGSGNKASTVPMLLLAVENGGTKLDAFDTVLPQLYSRVGFRPSSRTTWNDEFAPPEWDKKTFGDYNNGEPDVVFMHYDPESTKTFDQLSGTYDIDDASRNSLLRDEYDDAVNLQTTMMNEAQQRVDKTQLRELPKAPWKEKERALVPQIKAKQASQQILTPEVRDKNFKNWFGESQVVDEAGEPLVVYHGTPEEGIKVFEPERLGESSGATSMEGMFFSGKHGTASEYKKSELVLKPEHQKRFDALYDEKEKIEKKFGEPQGSKGLWYEIDKNKHPEEAARVRQINQQFSEIFSDQDMQRPKYWTKQESGEVMPVYLSMQEPFIYDAGGSAWTPDLDKKVNAMMRETAKEYDGIIIRNVYDSETGVVDDTYIVKDPKQIKSAVDNKGTFDPENPDITASIRPRMAARQILETA